MLSWLVLVKLAHHPTARQMMQHFQELHHLHDVSKRSILPLLLSRAILRCLQHIKISSVKYNSCLFHFQRYYKMHAVLHPCRNAKLNCVFVSYLLVLLNTNFKTVHTDLLDGPEDHYWYLHCHYKFRPCIFILTGKQLHLKPNLPNTTFYSNHLTIKWTTSFSYKQI